MKIPILMYSDAVGAHSGLARITRDLATRLVQHMPDQFKVATIGYGSPGSSRLHFHQYHWTFRDDFVIGELPEVWYDFAGQETGILMTVQDASRMLWLGRPDEGLGASEGDARLRKYLEKRPFRTAGYFPIDAAGINGKFTLPLAETYKGYDRVLAYTKWAERLLLQTMGEEASRLRGLTSLPHGLDTSVFYPRDRKQARATFRERLAGKPLSPSDKTLIGIVATNQARKDYGLGLQAVAEVAKKRDVVLWIHTDVLERTWSIPGLLYDLGLNETAFITYGNKSDEDLAWAYSACDVTLGIGLGEGMGFPIFESLACGCPVVHGDCGGAPEFMEDRMLVQPVATRLEGPYSIYRPVYDSHEWAEKILELTTNRPERRESMLPKELDWANLWDEWAEWFRALHKSVAGTVTGVGA